MSVNQQPRLRGGCTKLVTNFLLLVLLSFSASVFADPSHYRITGNGGWGHFKLGNNANNLWGPKISPAVGQSHLELTLNGNGSTDWNLLAIKSGGSSVILGDHINGQPNGFFTVSIPLSAFSADAFTNISNMSVPFARGPDSIDLSVAMVAFTGSGTPTVWFGDEQTLDNAYDSNWDVTFVAGDGNNEPTDSDNDGTPDASDNCPNDANADQADNDNDGQGNVCDSTPNGPVVSDADGDGIPDSQDNCPTDDNTNQADADEDGIGDVCDPTPNGNPTGPVGSFNYYHVTGNGGWGHFKLGHNNSNLWGPKISPATGHTHLRLTLNGFNETNWDEFAITTDGTSDRVILGDHISGSPTGWFSVDIPLSAFPADAFTNIANMSVPFSRGADSINMGIAAVEFVGGSNPFVWFGNPGKIDNVYDAQWDVTASSDTSGPTEPADADNDGVVDAEDNCPTTANEDQADNDNDGFGNACDATPNGPDADGDGVIDSADNCPNNANEDQADNDNDGEGNVCDSTPNGPIVVDTDGDGIEDAQDNCPTVVNEDQADADNDGTGDACEPSNANDIDNDGIPDEIDNCPNVSNPNQIDGDGDGNGNACDFDSDNDGVNDDVDNCPAFINPNQEDIDGDGIGDICDINDTSNGYSLRINAGGERYTDVEGNVWLADYRFNTGKTDNRDLEIIGTDDDYIYRTNRWDRPEGEELIYGLPVKSGNYRINLHFAELIFGPFGTNRRIFSVKVEDTIVVENLDVAQIVGRNTPHIESFEKFISDGQITIEFLHIADNPNISAIEVIALDENDSNPFENLIFTLTESQPRDLKFGDFAGINIFPDTPVETIAAFDNYRMYLPIDHFARNANSAHELEFNPAGWWLPNLDDMFTRISQENKDLMTTIQYNPNWMRNGDINSTEMPFNLSGINSNDVSSWQDYYDICYQLSARYGSNVNASATVNNTNQPLTGLGLIDRIQPRNEIYWWWGEDREYIKPNGEIEIRSVQDWAPEEEAALVTACNNGAKDADPEMEISMPALPGWDYHQMDRGKEHLNVINEGALPAEDYVVNVYWSRRNANIDRIYTDAFGIIRHPEYYGGMQEFMSEANQILKARHPNANLVIGEFGYDTNGSTFSVKGTTETSKEKQQAQFLVRSYLEMFAGGVERAYAFMIRGNNEGTFESMGIMENDYSPRMSWYFAAGTIEILRNAKYIENLQTNTPAVKGLSLVDSDGYKYYVLWSPTDNDSTETITLSIDESHGEIVRKDLIENNNGSLDYSPIVTVLGDANTTTVDIDVTETPTFIVVAPN